MRAINRSYFQLYALIIVKRNLDILYCLIYLFHGFVSQEINSDNIYFTFTLVFSKLFDLDCVLLLLEITPPHTYTLIQQLGLISYFCFASQIDYFVSTLSFHCNFKPIFHGEE